MLDILMKKQLELQEALGNSIQTMTTEERVKYVKEHSIHLTQELHEMLYELPFFKPWKDYSNISLDETVECLDKAWKEFIDMFHFTLNIALALGMSAQDIFDGYIVKNEENHARQADGYTHDKSYR